MASTFIQPLGHSSCTAFRQFSAIKYNLRDDEVSFPESVGLKMMWEPTDNGKTIGTKGSAEGKIVMDEEHTDGARVTLERGGSNAPVGQ